MLQDLLVHPLYTPAGRTNLPGKPLNGSSVEVGTVHPEGMDSAFTLSDKQASSFQCS